MKKILLSTALIALLSLSAEANTAPATQIQTEENEVKTTKVTAENYGKAETEMIMSGCVKKIAKATGADGVGIIWNVREVQTLKTEPSYVSTLTRSTLGL